MSFDQHANLAYSTIAAAPSPANTGTTLSVQTGDGTLFLATPFNTTVWPPSVAPTAANAEIVRVTNISADTFTITRQQEGSNQQSIGVGWQIGNTITAKIFLDLENAVTALQAVPPGASNAFVIAMASAL